MACISLLQRSVEASIAAFGSNEGEFHTDTIACFLLITAFGGKKPVQLSNVGVFGLTQEAENIRMTASDVELITFETNGVVIVTNLIWDR